MQQSAQTAYLFPGQGSQTLGMGRQLVLLDPGAGRLLDIASELSGHPLRQYCWEGPFDILSRTDVLQPSLAAISLACLRALQTQDIEPDVVAGHSLGEFVALVAANVLTAEDCLRLVCERARLMHAASLSRPGVMSAVNGMRADELERIVGDVPAPLAIAAYNSPRQTVLSGAPAGVAEAERRLRQAGARSTRLSVSGAWHSPLMAEANEGFRSLLARIRLEPPTRRVFFNALGGEARAPDEIRAALELQMVSPVRWTQAIRSAIEAGVTTFVEVGPGRTLRTLLRHIWPDYLAYTSYGVDGPLPVRAPAVVDSMAAAQRPDTSRLKNGVCSQHEPQTGGA